MALFKCKACGGDIIPNEDKYTGKCEYCGTIQTLPKDKDERISQLLNRANDYRMHCDFDRAIFEYEKALELNGTEPEVHWGLFLSKYGVEYVKDTMTFTYKPTLHRISSISVFDDVDYQATIKYADSISAMQYKKDAENIETVMKELLLLSVNQEPYDVFLSYKEVDDTTRQRTDDSYLAHDLYNELTAQGYKVFFAPKSLGVGLYEPKIYSAIISAKVMIVLGTKPQYFDAVWVKNEWSRFAELIENGEHKAIIPVFKNMEAESLPNRLAKFQAYNMDNMSFLPSLLNIISQYVNRQSQVKFNKDTTAEDAFLERGFLALEDSNFSQAESFFENVLNLNPHNSQAYFGKLMVEMRITKQEQILTSSKYLNEYKNFEKAVRFADQQLKTTLLQYEQKVYNSINDQILNSQQEKMKKVESEDDLNEIINSLNRIIDYNNVRTIDAFLEKNFEILTQIKSECAGIEQELSNDSQEASKIKSSLIFENTCFLFRIVGCLCGVVLLVCGVIGCIQEYDWFFGILLGIIAGGITGAIVGAIGFGIGYLLDETVGRLFSYLVFKIRSQKRRQALQKIEDDINNKQQQILILTQNYSNMISDIQQYEFD